MQIILEAKHSSKLDDTVDYILTADNKTFNRIMKTLKNPNGQLDIHYKDEKKFETLELVVVTDLILKYRGLNKDQYNDKQKKRIEKISNSRSQKDFERHIRRQYGVSKSEAEEIIRVLTGEKAKDERKKLKYSIIKQFLNTERCSEKITKKEAIEILKDLGISENKLEITYREITQN